MGRNRVAILDKRSEGPFGSMARITKNHDTNNTPSVSSTTQTSTCSAKRRFRELDGCHNNMPSTMKPSFFVSPPQSPARQKFVVSPLFQNNTTVITQSSDSEMDFEDYYEVHSLHNVPNKKKRIGNYHQELISDELQSNAKDSSSSVAWWKKKKKKKAIGSQTAKPAHNHSTPQICFVCQTPAQQLPDSSIKKDWQSLLESKPPPKQKNSLLSYFHTSNGARSSTTTNNSRQKSTTITTLDVCTHCDHYSCSICSHTCERCAGRFCSFCSTINYDGPTERMLCLECNRLASGEIFCQEDNDVMMDMN